jgi:hypothetical protein
MDLGSRGEIRPDRPPHHPHPQGHPKLYYIVFGEYYILCGSPCKPLKGWLIGTWTNGEWRNKDRARLSFGQVEVPALAQTEKAVIIDSNDVKVG